MIKFLSAFALTCAFALAGFAHPRSAVAATPGAWSALGSAGPGVGAIVQGNVFDIAKIGNEIFVAGGFINAANLANADNLARWNGSNWSAVGMNTEGGPVFNAAVRSLAVSNGILYAAGDFTNAAGIEGADYLAKWNGTSWSAIGARDDGSAAIPTRPDSGGPTQGIAVAVQGSNVYIGGSFDDVDGIPEADNLAHWDGIEWHALGSGGPGQPALKSAVHTLLIGEAGLYAGGSFRDAANLPEADYLALWNDTSWSALGSNGSGDGRLPGTVSALTFLNGDLYVGGSINFYEILRWDGDAWHPLSEDEEAAGHNGFVYSLGVYDGKLVAAGNITEPFDYVGIWNGTSWSTLGPDGALDYLVFALLIVDGDVFAGGSFSDAGGIDTADRVALLEISSDHQPDLRIAKPGGSLLGNNIYNSDAANQQITGNRKRGKTATFNLSIQNDGTVRERFTVRATGAATSMYRVKYFKGTTDITSQVVAGTYRTPLLSAGGKVLITAKVKVLASATLGTNVIRLVTATSTLGSGGVDAVKLMVRRN